MSSLNKYRMSLVLFVASSFPIALLSLYIHEVFLILFVVNILLWSWMSRRVLCPKCGTPIAPPIGASALAILRSFSNTACRNCSTRID
jgi:hypothetical protein